MQLWEILVPTIRNSGKPFTTRHHREWDKRVRKVANGLTIYTPAKGNWLDAEGKLFSERMIPVRIACNEATIKKIMDIAAQHYEQLAVMAYQVSANVLIKDYSQSVAQAAKPFAYDEAEHIRMAKFYAARVGMYGTLFITCRVRDHWYLEERTFSGPEVDWSIKHTFNSKEEAVAVKAAGICKDWMNCLND